MPLPLRILLLLVFFAFYGALIYVIIMVGVYNIKEGRIFDAVVIFAIAALIAAAVIVWLIRTCKSKHIR